MKFLKSIGFVFAFFYLGLLHAQDYKFIPKNQHLLTDEDAKTMEFAITPDVLLFSDQGQRLPMSQVELMTNSDYTPFFYVDAEQKLKSIVFKRNTSKNNTITTNLESEFIKGEKALDFIITDLEGNTFKLSDLKGQVVVLNFWFTTCGPCMMEMPQLNKLRSSFKTKKVKFFAITFDKKETVEQFLKKNKFDFTITPNANDVIMMYGVQNYPTTIVINKNGEIIAKEIGYRTNIEPVLTTFINAGL
ncbi:peroxiredoxin family protein [Olleya sp. HaHaR_3_96]|uniref:peroxiredoxin family protein n=1 Tax=Olleya sp. HaHaR_3_96 TaxID=2745560 RepID=UPI001C5021AA|nr:TlpA disulfide reductase family protein [Olleya sp. HaHaR_3_96]QXP61057.1 TlpA family protein disulfide reductase [Olleya sp. HaHaR_3_96]